MHRALLVADRATGTAVVVEPVPVTGADLDDRVLRAGAEAAVALEAVAARQAAASLVARLALGQAADHLGEVIDPPGRLAFWLPPPLGVGEIPRMQLVEVGQVVLGR